MFYGHQSLITHAFMDIHWDILECLWISIGISVDVYGYPCFDLLWNLNPGIGAVVRV